MRHVSLCALFVFALLPSRALKAGMVFSFAQTAEKITATDDTQSTTFTNSFANYSAPLVQLDGLPGFLSFAGVKSVSSAVYNPTTGLDVQNVSGSVMVNSKADGTGINLMTATFTNALLETIDGGVTTGVSGALTTSGLIGGPTFSGTTVTLASDMYTFSGKQNFLLDFYFINPHSSIDGSTIAGFQANVAGVYFAEGISSAPEPSTVVSALLGILSLGYFASRRRNCPTRNVLGVQGGTFTGCQRRV